MGDRIRISFASSPNLDTEQMIRRDGRINLGIVGEVVAAEKTPVQLEKELIELFSTQLVSKEIKVIVVSSAYAVFVSGAVLKPGKVMPERVLTPLEAVMEAGGPDTTRANMKKVRVVREETGETFELNLQATLDGKATQPFYLKSHDIVFVPEKFVIF